MRQAPEHRHAAVLAILLAFASGCAQKAEPVKRGDTLHLPAPNLIGEVSVEQALNQRRSVRAFQDAPLTLSQVGQLLWACQGVTAERGRRTAPSAGATYPLECYLIAGRVESLTPGVYHYLPRQHALESSGGTDRRAALAAAALGQASVANAPVSIVIAADFERTTKRYAERGRQYVYIEVGHAAENVHLECEALGLGMVCIGAFEDDAVRKVVGCPEAPLYILPIGRKQEK
jgi:SagB-type dehydrogenase family enzyme